MKDLDFNIIDTIIKNNFLITKDAIIDNENNYNKIISYGNGSPANNIDTYLYIDKTNNRLYVLIDGVYKYTSLI